MIQIPGQVRKDNKTNLPKRQKRVFLPDKFWQIQHGYLDLFHISVAFNVINQI